VIGTSLNLTLPATSDTLTTIVDTVRTALSALEDSVAQKATPAGLDIISSLSMGGNWLTNTGAVSFVGGNTPTAPGSVYYAGGEFFFITDDGTVQLTSAGAIDVGSVGGITGMSGNAAVNYSGGTTQYRFFSDTGIYADVVCDDLILEGDNGTVSLGVDSALSGNKVVNFKTIPASGISLVAYDAANTAIQSGGTAKITETTSFTAASVDTLTVTTADKHSFTKTRRVPIHNGVNQGTGTYSLPSGPDQFTLVSGHATLYFNQLCGLESGDQPTVVRLRMYKSTGGTATVYLYRNTPDAGPTAIGAPFTTTVVGATTMTCTIPSPVTLAAGDDLHIKINFAADGDVLYSIAVDFTRP
jgi:hypothetical protein